MLLPWAGLESLDVGLTAFLAALLILTVWQESRPLPGGPWSGAKARDRLVAVAYLALVVGCSGFLAANGKLRDFSARPPRMLMLLLPITVTTLIVALSPLGRRIAAQAPLWVLVGFQSFRVLVELLLWGIHRQGVLPVQMTFEGYNFDILTGLSAIGFGWAAMTGKVSNRVLWIWNLCGLALLINIVTIAVLSMPTPLRAFSRGPTNTIVAELPFVWIPCVMVQAGLFGHILLFRALRARARVAMPIQAARAATGA